MKSSSRQRDRSHSPNSRPLTLNQIRHKNADSIIIAIIIFVIMISAFFMAICTGIVVAFFVTLAENHVLSQTGNYIGKYLIYVLLKSIAVVHMVPKCMSTFGSLFVFRCSALFKLAFGW